MKVDELFPLHSEQIDSKDFKIILNQYARYWYLFVASTMLCLIISFIYLRYYAVRQYKVSSTLLIKDDKSGNDISNADAFNDLNAFKATRNIDNETEILKSKGLMRRVVNELGLFTTFYIEGKIKNQEIYGTVLPIRVIVNKLDSTAQGKTFAVYLKRDNSFDLDDNTGRITTHSFGRQINKPYGSFTIIATAAKALARRKIIVSIQNLQQVANYYNQSIVIQPVNKNASILSISLIGPIPDKSADVVNKLMDVYNREAVEDKNLMATNTLKFLDERLKYLTSDLSVVEKEVERYKSLNQVTDIGTQATNYTEQASNYNKQLSEWAIQIEVLESIENYLKKSGTSFSSVPSTLGIQDATLLNLIEKFNELQVERERMLRTTQPGNPLVQNLTEQLINLRLNILENLHNIKQGLQITSKNLKSNSDQFQSKIKNIPAMERQLLEINRQQSIKQNIYSYLLQKREETALSLAATASAARVIDPATGEGDLVSPNGQIIYLTALLLGFGLPLAGIYIRNSLNNKVTKQQDITSTIKVPVLGEIAHNGNGTVVVGKNNRNRIAEMFRLVRANINFLAVGKQNLVLLVTSSTSGEGKTFFSINLGASLALTGKRVILLDLDLRSPKVAVELELPQSLGITDYLLLNNVSLKDMIRSSEKVPDLFVISSGPIPPNPSELLMSTKFANLIHELKENFDYIIIDTPPIGQVADAFTLNLLIDFTIYIVRYNFTLKTQLATLREICNNKTMNNPAIVLNDAAEINGYGYAYGYGQPDSKQKKSTRPRLKV